MTDGGGGLAVRQATYVCGACMVACAVLFLQPSLAFPNCLCFFSPIRGAFPLLFAVSAGLVVGGNVKSQVMVAVDSDVNGGGRWAENKPAYFLTYTPCTSVITTTISSSSRPPPSFLVSSPPLIPLFFFFVGASFVLLFCLAILPVLSGV